MKIGLLKEIKKEEYRTGLTPCSAREYIRHGHQIYVETMAGEGSAISDEDYAKVGCSIVSDRRKICDACDMIIKVKEPLVEEYDLFHAGQILYTYLHLAANESLTKMLLKNKVTGIAYETIMESDGSLPLLKPMSEIAGRLSVQEGAKYLEKTFGGRGVLLGGVPGIRRGKVTIIGGGVVGSNACKMAVGLGAEVTILDISANRLARLDDIYGNRITTLYSNEGSIAECICEADLVIGAVLIPGAAAPKVIRREQLSSMKKGAVIVDVAVDQGGCFETTHATYHSDPTFILDGIVHYCVANMPGAVSMSSTYALTGVTNHYGLQIADKGVEEAVKTSRALREGVNTMKGELKNEAVGRSLGLPFSA